MRYKSEELDIMFSNTSQLLCEGADSAAPFSQNSSNRIRDSILRDVKKIPYPLPMEDLVPSFRQLDDSLYALLMKQRLDLSTLPPPCNSISSQTYFLFGHIRAELDRFPLSVKLLERFYQFFCAYAQSLISNDASGVITDMTDPNILAFFTNNIRLITSDGDKSTCFS